MSPFDTQVARRFADKVTADIAKKGDEVARGLARDMGDYGKRCGNIAGLTLALELLKDAERELLGGSPTEKR